MASNPHFAEMILNMQKDFEKEYRKSKDDYMAPHPEEKFGPKKLIASFQEPGFHQFGDRPKFYDQKVEGMGGHHPHFGEPDFVSVFGFLTS